MGVDTAVPGVGFGSQNKEAQGLMKIMQALKVKVGSIHNIEGSGFWNKQVKDVDLMVAVITVYTSAECVPGKVIHHL